MQILFQDTGLGTVDITLGMADKDWQSSGEAEITQVIINAMGSSWKFRVLVSHNQANLSSFDKREKVYVRKWHSNWETNN